MSTDQTATTPAATAPGMTGPRVDGAAAGPLPAITLRAYALAAVASMLRDAAPGKSHEVDFLLDHLAAVAPENTHWIATLPDYLERPNAADRPLIELSLALGLTLIEMLAVALAAAV